MKIAIIGSQGVPAKYGGFETLVENIIEKSDRAYMQYTVYCGGKDYLVHIDEYKGACLKYISLHANGYQSILYDILSMISCIGKGYDDVLILGVSGCMFLPIFRLFFKKRIIINIDGLEHKREKWSKFARWFLKTSEKYAVKYADVVVSDNKYIQDYVRDSYGKESELIAYGGDHAIRNVNAETTSSILEQYNVSPKHYCISVCRIEPENNCHIILEAFSKSDTNLIFIGNWDRSEYGRKLKEEYSHFHNIRISDPIYDLDTLYVLRMNASLYLHGHSAGGTNPSLVEAMQLGIPISAYDVSYNRSTTENKALYFKNCNDLSEIISKNELWPSFGTPMKRIAEKNYSWAEITKKYENLFISL